MFAVSTDAHDQCERHHTPTAPEYNEATTGTVPEPPQAAARRAAATLRSWLGANKPLVLLIALCVVMLVANAAWVDAHRRAGAMNIDEAGYLSMSVTDYGALRDGGLLHMARTVLQQPVQAPLVPLLSALVYAAVGRPTVVGAYAVEVVSLVLLMLASYGVCVRLASRWAGLVAALAVGSLPIVVDYAHEYMFALPAATAAMVAVWALVRSDALRRKWLAVTWGAGLGAMIIARTMAVAFLPGFVLAAALMVMASPQRRRSLAGLTCGLAAFLVVAGPWYFKQGRSVWAYLTSYGYGAASSSYGQSRSLFSPASWLLTARDNINNYVWLPLALIMAAGLLAFLVLVVGRLLGHRRTGLRAAGSPWLHLAVIVLVGLAAMQSSRNQGTGFAAPILPVVVILAVAALDRAVRRHTVAQTAVLCAIALACLPSLVAKTAFDSASGQPIIVQVPGAGPLVVIDGRSQYLMYVSVMPKAHRDDPDGDTWRTANDRLRAVLDQLPTVADRDPILLSFGQRLVNSNTILWEELMTHGTSPPVWLLAPSSDGAGGYSDQLATLLPDGGTVLVCSDPPSMINPVLNQDQVRDALRHSGFALARFFSLPDGAAVEIWTR